MLCQIIELSKTIQTWVQFSVMTMFDITDEEVRIHVNSCFMFNEVKVNVETEPLTECNSSKSRPVKEEIICQQNSRQYCVNQNRQYLKDGGFSGEVKQVY